MARPGEFQELPEEMIRVACGMHSGPTYRTVNTQPYVVQDLVR